MLRIPVTNLPLPPILCPSPNKDKLENYYTCNDFGELCSDNDTSSFLVIDLASDDDDSKISDDMTIRRLQDWAKCVAILEKVFFCLRSVKIVNSFWAFDVYFICWCF